MGHSENSPGATGYVALAHLVYEQPDSPVYTGELSDKEKQAVALLPDTGLSDAALGTYPSGTQARLLGRSLGYYQVAIGEDIGFVPLDKLSFDDAAAKALAALMEGRTLDQVQPGWEARKEAFDLKLVTLYNRNGAMGSWTLEQMAQGSQLALEYGFEWMSDSLVPGRPIVNVTPGPGDMTREQAYDRALALAMDRFGFEPSAVAQESVSFYYPQGQPEERIWHVRLWLLGVRDCSVYMDAKGETLEIRQIPGKIMGQGIKVKKEEAIRIAREAVIRELGRSLADVESWETSLSFEWENSWVVSIMVPDSIAPGHNGFDLVRIDAMTGEVLSVSAAEGNG